MSEAIMYAPAQGNAAAGAMRARLERELNERDGFDCFYCGQNLRMLRRNRVQVDHVRPVARGGSDLVDNLVWSCRECNLLKGTAPAWFFVFWRENPHGVRAGTQPRSAKA